MATTPLRFPGGKSKALTQIFARFPHEIREFREPCVGGGSVFLRVRQLWPNVHVWISDADSEVIAFWTTVQRRLHLLVSTVKQVKQRATDGRALFDYLTAIDPTTLAPVERATRFFVLNRITFSGTVEAGGYSEAAFRERFTDSSIDRLAALGPALQDVLVTCQSYQALLEREGRDVFIFCDPPYYSTSKSRLYGKNGALHTRFDHKTFALDMQACTHKWLITLDDSPFVREQFAWARMEPWVTTYSMDNYKQDHTKIGRELFIQNYEA